MTRFDDFAEIWAVDFEFRKDPGETPHPVCAVGREVRSGRLLTLWEEDLRKRRTSPFGNGSRSLLVSYSCSAELGCFRALGWPYPERILDLYCEFRSHTNFESRAGGIDTSLRGALSYFEDHLPQSEDKREMRDLILGQSDYGSAERGRILEYCGRDVEDAARLLRIMEPRIDLDRALLRGRYGKAVTEMEWAGVPVDDDLLKRLRANWGRLRLNLVAEVDKAFGVFESGHLRFDRLARWAEERGVRWPRTPHGRLRTDKSTCRDLAHRYPILEGLAEVLRIDRQLKKLDFPVGSDGRNRCPIMPFAAMTGRNQPRTSEFMLGGPTWLRSLIRPRPGRGLAYVDWDKQEFGMGAALSNDPRMREAYLSGDCYLAFGVQAGILPRDATKATHPKQRDQLKSALLSIQYQSSAPSLAFKLGISEEDARQLIESHRRLYRDYWKWVDAVETCFLVEGRIQTVFGWMLQRRRSGKPNMRAVANFPIQANGAEMMRLACCLTTERGVQVCAPLHDAFLIEAPLNELDEAIQVTRSAMEEASQQVLNGFRLKTESQVFRHPDRFRDPRGDEMWAVVMNLLNQIDGKETPCARA
jgi:DNA polymerase I